MASETQRLCKGGRLELNLQIGFIFSSAGAHFLLSLAGSPRRHEQSLICVVWMRAPWDEAMR
jgi:hypothetical protein